MLTREDKRYVETTMKRHVGVVIDQFHHEMTLLRELFSVRPTREEVVEMIDDKTPALVQKELARRKNI